MKIRLLGAELFHADERTKGWTDMTKLTVALRNFANGLKNSYLNGEPKRNGEKKHDHLQLLTCHLRASVVCINPLKPTGYVMHQQFNIQQLYALPTLHL